MQRRPSQTEDKLLLLYALDKLGAVTNQQALRFVAENDLMGFLNFALSFAESEEAGFLRKSAHRIGTLYRLTGKGHDMLMHFEKRVPYSRRKAVDELAEAWRARFQRERTILSDWKSDEHGQFIVQLLLLERDMELADIRINVPTREQAEQFCNAWEARASSIYAHMMRSLGENDPPTDAP